MVDFTLEERGWALYNLYFSTNTENMDVTIHRLMLNMIKDIEKHNQQPDLFGHYPLDKIFRDGWLEDMKTEVVKDTLKQI